MRSMNPFRASKGIVSFFMLCVALALTSTIGPRVARAGDDAAAKAPTAVDSVAISDAWAHATPSGSHMGAIYLKLISAKGDRLLRASVPHSITSETQIHETVVHHDSTTGGDTMEMHQVESVDLPAGQTVELKPGSFHLMLIGLKHALKAGDKVSVTLHFEKAGMRTVKADVRSI
jgi:periplasmic copper chaperone A